MASITQTFSHRVSTLWALFDGVPGESDAGRCNDVDLLYSYAIRNCGIWTIIYSRKLSSNSAQSGVAHLSKASCLFTCLLCHVC